MKELFIRKNDKGGYDEKLLKKFMDSLGNGRLWQLRATDKSKRTLNQNDYFHSILPDLQVALYEAGWEDVTTPLRAKTRIKKWFLTQEVTNVKTGEVDTVIRDTSDLTIPEFSQFLDELTIWAATYLSLTLTPRGKQSEMFNKAA